MSNIFFTSDLHFCHDRDFVYQPRGFSSIYEMNEAIVKNWNEVVRYGDCVYILGDIMLNNNEQGISLLNRLNGNKYIIIGNHDTDTRVRMYEAVCYETILGYAHIEKIGGQRFYLSHYPTLTSNIREEKPLSKRMVNLCGHLHTQDRFCDIDKGLIYHCELDAHNNTPVSIEEIISDIRKVVA